MEFFFLLLEKARKKQRALLFFVSTSALIKLTDEEVSEATGRNRLGSACRSSVAALQSFLYDS